MKNVIVSFLIGAAIAIPICGCAGTQWYRLPDNPTREQAYYDREDAPLEIWEKGSMAVCEAMFGKVKKAPGPTAIGTEARNR